MLSKHDSQYVMMNEMVSHFEKETNKQTKKIFLVWCGEAWAGMTSDSGSYLNAWY